MIFDIKTFFRTLLDFTVAFHPSTCFSLLDMIKF